MAKLLVSIHYRYRLHATLNLDFTRISLGLSIPESPTLDTAPRRCQHRGTLALSSMTCEIGPSSRSRAHLLPQKPKLLYTESTVLDDDSAPRAFSYRYRQVVTFLFVMHLLKSTASSSSPLGSGANFQWIELPARRARSSKIGNGSTGAQAFSSIFAAFSSFDTVQDHGLGVPGRGSAVVKPGHGISFFCELSWIFRTGTCIGTRPLRNDFSPAVMLGARGPNTGAVVGFSQCSAGFSWILPVGMVRYIEESR